MRLRNVLIRNFRGLKEVEFELPTDLTVIVGPNAIGKTSILEAVRMAKSILMESYDGEGMQVLQTLGVMSPNIGRVTFSSFLGDVTKQLLVRLTLGLSAGELSGLRSSATQIAIIYLRDRMGIRGDETTVMRLLSSPEGQKQLEALSSEIQARLDLVEKSGSVTISLSADPVANVIRGGDLIEQVLATHLARSAVPSQGLFSYFPADRAMPPGEVGIQLGTPDMQQQMQSHMGMPALKYARLKNYVVTQFLMGENPRKQLRLSSTSNGSRTVRSVKQGA